jgi:hypothetical protein
MTGTRLIPKGLRARVRLLARRLVLWGGLRAYFA